MQRKIFVLGLILSFAGFFLNAGVSRADDFAIGTTLEDFNLPATDGKTYSFDDLKGENGTVVMFLSAQCPVVKAYIQRINQVAADYKAKGINFIGVNSNATESLEWVTSDASENFKFPMLIDKGNILADKLGATVTPEAYYFDSKKTLLYHGAIDNDRSGKNVTHTYLRTAFETSLNGKPIEMTRANAFGCSIKRVGEENYTAMNAIRFIGKGALLGGLLGLVLLLDAAAQNGGPSGHGISVSRSSGKFAQSVKQIDAVGLKNLLKPNGRPLLINFWATWCDPCRDEFPDLVKLDSEFRGKIDFITVTLDDVEEINRAVPKFLSNMKAEMPTFLLKTEDENEAIKSVAQDWKGGLPFTILFNTDGTIAYFRQGPINPNIVGTEIGKLLPQDK